MCVCGGIGMVHYRGEPHIASYLVGSSAGLQKTFASKKATTFGGPIGTASLVAAARSTGTIISGLTKFFSKRKLGDTISKKSSIVGGAGAGAVTASTIGGSTGVGTLVAAFPQGAGFGLGYGVGVRAGYELGFPTLFGEKGSSKRTTVIQKGLGLDPSTWLDALRGISGGLDLGLGKGGSIRDKSAETSSRFFLGGSPPAFDEPPESIGFTDSLSLSGSATLPSGTSSEVLFKRWMGLIEKHTAIKRISHTAPELGPAYTLLVDAKKKFIDAMIRSGTSPSQASRIAIQLRKEYFG